jgi:anti-sigma factor ChrR (cupin superfamily)
MAPFHHDLSPFLALRLDDGALAKLVWRDFGDGTELAKLAREGETGLVLYRIAPASAPRSFASHVHTGGEAYLVLKGAIVDESGTYPAGSFVWMKPGSQHTPRGWEQSETLVLVLWPEGVRTSGRS